MTINILNYLNMATFIILTIFFIIGVDYYDHKSEYNRMLKELAEQLFTKNINKLNG